MDISGASITTATTSSSQETEMFDVSGENHSAIGDDSSSAFDCNCFPWTAYTYKKDVQPVQTSSPDEVDNNNDEAVQENPVAIDPPEQTIPMDSKWQADFFKKFEWLNKPRDTDSSSSDEYQEYRVVDPQKTARFEEKCKLFNDACAYMEKLLAKTDVDVDVNKDVSTDPLVNPEMANLLLYFVALENNKMLLHASFKKPVEQIMRDCNFLYSFAQTNLPTKVVFIMDNIDFYDVDKYVKMYMQLFGIDDTRGGSYKETFLPGYVKDNILREFQITSLDYYVNQETLLRIAMANT